MVGDQKYSYSFKIFLYNISYYKKAGVCLSFCLSVTEKFVDLSPSAETRLRRAYFVGQTDTHGRNW